MKWAVVMVIVESMISVFGQNSTIINWNKNECNQVRSGNVDIAKSD